MLWSQLGVQGTLGQQSTTQPTRSTSETQLDQWNQAFRQSAVYQNFMRANNLPTNGMVKLSRAQQAALEQEMARAGIKVPDGMHIDQGGNLNQRNTLGRNLAIGGAIGGATLATLGAAGVLGGGGAFGGGAAGGAGASGSFGGAAGAAGAGGAGGALVPLTAATGATGVGALGPGAGGALGGTSASGLGGAIAGGGGAATTAAAGGGGSILNSILRYAIPSIGTIVNGYLGNRAANQAADTLERYGQQAIDTTNRLTDQAIGQQGQLYNNARASVTDAYNQAGQTQAQVYNQNAANFSPYMQLGAGSIGNLSAMTGGGPIQVPTSFYSPVSAPQFSAANVPVRAMTAPPTQNQVGTPSIPAPIPTSTPDSTATPPPQAESPQVQAQVASASSYRPGSIAGLSQGDALVTVKAPTGETRQMPLSQAQAYVQAGAQIVS